MHPTSERAKILLVDDEPRNLQLLRQILKEQYDLIFAKSGHDAIYAALHHHPDLILLDIMMPDMDGYQVCRLLKQDHRSRATPIIFVSAMNDELDESYGFELGAVDYIAKPVRLSVVRQRIKTHLALSNQNRSCQQQLEQQHQMLRETRLRSLMMLGKAAEYKDNETGLHVQRMARYSAILARAYGWNDSSCELMLNAAPMHDVGKIGIPDRILQKPAALDHDEWSIMRRHPQLGADIIGQIAGESELFQMAESIALTHHEKWNGKGYPAELAAEAIPIEGRIVAIADVFDALTTRRPYKDPWSINRAVDLLQAEAGYHFDPQLVALFTEQLPQIMEVMHQWSNASEFESSPT